MPAKRMIITDLDGTLMRSDGGFSPADLGSLRRAAGFDAIRVLATGRSPYSFAKSVSEKLPIDFILFSTGAAIVAYPDGGFLRAEHLQPRQVSAVCELLCGMNLDFMMHDPFPDNHRFRYRCSGNENPDFFRRLDRYRAVARPLDGVGCSNPESDGIVSQFLVVAPPREAVPVWERLRAAFPGLSVIRSTSPLDHESMWIEIFHPCVSKSRAAQWLCRKLGVSREDVLAIGNDYNDLDLLEWAGAAMLVANAPEPLRARFATVSSHDAAGVSEAIEKWLKMR
ncbi:HAD family hydrolase [Desulfatirhabdium butyrativorans]|uniref:HAD family hydrolase n=1 Tax=Desulfatirhabdium butyrativorans TaxID=340467 RepID=UPI00146FB24A|nr:HAD family hydrolase [Desulfatirhabdium butyrativorans]